MLRRLAGGLLRSLGLTRAARADAAARDLRVAQRRIAKLEGALAEARAGAEREVERYREAKLKYQEALRHKLGEQLAGLDRALTSASRDRLLAHGQLTLVETKLDVLEGAIQALDTRTREVLVAREKDTPLQGS